MSDEILSTHADHVEAATAAMSAARASGASLPDSAAAGVAASNHLGFLPVAALTAVITAAYDRLTAGDAKWLPGDNSDPTSLESLVEKAGRDLIPMLVSFASKLLGMD